MSSIPAYSAADIGALLVLGRRELGTAHESAGIPVGDSGWRGVLDAALDHGLVGILWGAASKTQGVPAHLLESIRTAYVAQAARNLQLAGALVEILRTFDGSGVAP